MNETLIVFLITGSALLAGTVMFFAGKVYESMERVKQNPYENGYVFATGILYWLVALIFLFNLGIGFYEGVK